MIIDWGAGGTAGTAPYIRYMHALPRCMLHTYHHHPSTLASQCCNSNELKICIYDIELRYMHLYAAWLREWPLQSWKPVRHDYGYRIVPNYLVNYLQLWDKRPLVIPCEKYFLVLVLDCLLYYAFALDKLPIGYAKWLSASLKASKSTGGRFLHVFNYEVGPGFCMKLGMRPPLKSEPNTYMCLTQFFILSVWLNSYIYEHQRVES